MLKANRLVFGLAIMVSATLLFSFSKGEINPRLKQKIDSAILSAYEVEHSALKSVTISADINNQTLADFGENNLFEIFSDTNRIGFLYLGEAPSMKRKFDYIIMFNTDFTIKKSKVLIYREEHGKQIGSQRWLKQFIGLSSGDNLTYGENIDAISGATISASSMTKAIGNVLKSIEILRKKEVLK